MSFVAPCMPNERRGTDITLEKKVLSTCWLLKTTETYSSIADRFAMHDGSLYRSALQVIHALVDRSHEIICWPTDYDQESREWEAIAGYPGIIGNEM